MAFQNTPLDDNANGVRDDLIKELSAVKVSDLALKDKAIILNAKTPPKKALEVLVKNKVRAAPVVDNNNFVGVLDLRDTLGFALESYKLAKKAKQNQKNVVNTSNDDQKSDIINNVQIGVTLTDLCSKRPFRIVKETDNLLEVCRVFALGSHVVGVVSASSKQLVAVITQGYFFQQICKKWKFNSNCSLQKILDLKYITSPIKFISRNAKAIEAFELMNKLDLSGLAVVDDDGVLIHNTSATDIKLWLFASQTLEDSIEQFLINIRNLALVEKYPITICLLKDTFKRAVQKLQATKYHRLWIVDADTKPIGVLALTDIYRFISKTKEQNINNVPVPVPVAAAPIVSTPPNNDNNDNNNDNAANNDNDNNNDATT